MINEILNEFTSFSHYYSLKDFMMVEPRLVPFEKIFRSNLFKLVP